MEEEDFENIPQLIGARHTLLFILKHHDKRENSGGDDFSIALSNALDVFYQKRIRYSSIEICQSICAIRRIISVLEFVQFDNWINDEATPLRPRMESCIQELNCAVDVLSRFKEKLEDEWR